MTLSSLVQAERPEVLRNSPRAWAREALAIGERACAEAVVAGDRCNWLVRQIIYPKGFQPKDRPTLKPLGANVYDGTAGVSLMLARLTALEDRPAFRERSIQALNHALRHDWDGEDPLRRLGFYSGLSGLAWTAHEVGLRFGRPDLVEVRDRLLRHLLALEPRGEYQDLIFGAAGAVPALCRMHQDDPSAEAALELADRMVRRLLATAQWDGDKASWDGARTHGLHTPNLTGLSHGTSGIAWGLATYASYRGDSDALDAAVGALRYEESWFVEEDADWQDLRNDFAPDTPLSKRYANVWCHGSPGIGLSRLAFDVEAAIPHPVRRDLEAAADRTRDSLSRWWLNPGSDVCVCHGVAGNAEALSLMETALGGDGRATMRDWSAWLVARYGQAAGVDWPTAVTVGQYPTLMTGAGSAAQFLARAARPDLFEPLVLPPHPRKAAR